MLDRLSKLVETQIQSLDLPQEPANLYAPISYTLESGGKRIRPVMVLLTASMFDAPVESAMKAAMAIEVFHNFTLLHDDIMDNASVRRGRDTVHVKWSENVAILSGDAMIIYAYKLLSQCKTNRFAELFDAFNELAALVCEGQQLDMDFENNDDTTIDSYIEMITLKTSALIAGALKMGAIVANAPESDCDKLYNIGINLGIAFQLQDDLLDTYGDESLFGKRIGGDILEKKKTFLLINALRNSSSDMREKLISVINSDTLDDSAKISEVKAIYNQLNIKEVTEQTIDSYYNKAMAIIDSLTLSDDKLSPIRELAQKLVIRNK